MAPAHNPLFSYFFFSFHILPGGNNTQSSTREPSISNSFGGSTSTLRSPTEHKETTKAPPAEDPGGKHGPPKLQEPDVIASTKAGGFAPTLVLLTHIS